MIKGLKYQRGFIRVEDPPEQSSALLYPLLGSSRIGSKNYGEDDPTSAIQREALSYMDIVLLGGFTGTEMDTGASGWLTRGQITKDIYDRAVAKGNTGIIIGTYYNAMETSIDSGSVKTLKVLSEDGPPAGIVNWAPNPSDWFSRDASGDPAATFGTSIGVNLSNEVIPDSNGDRYAVWYSKNETPQYIQVQLDAGVPVENLAMYFDNYQVNARISGIDWDGDGVEEDAQDYYDPDNPDHMTGVDGNGSLRSEVTQHITEWRVEYRNGMDTSAGLFPGINLWGNTNTWWEPFGSGDTATLGQYVMQGYRLNSDPQVASIHIGFSEKNTANDIVFGWPRSGVGSDGILKTGGSWRASYNSSHVSQSLLSGVGAVAFSFRVDCTEPASPSTTPDGELVYETYPQPGAVYHLHRWTFCSSQLGGTYYTCSGIVIGTLRTGTGRSTMLFDEYGLVNQGTTGLSRKWMGEAIDSVQVIKRADHSFGELWWREFENALVIVNTDNDRSNPSATVPVVALPGGIGAWKRINGLQDPSYNDGSVVSESFFQIQPVDGIVLQRNV